MTTNDIIAALDQCSYVQLIEIRSALDARAEMLKTEIMQQAKAMGLACHDGITRPRKPRINKPQDEN